MSRFAEGGLPISVSRSTPSPDSKASVRTGKRRLAREMALQMLYQLDVGGSSLPNIYRTFDLTEVLRAEAKRPRSGERQSPQRLQKRVEEAFEYGKMLVEGAVHHREEIDGLIREQADNWRLERMPVVDRNILRLAIFEMLHEEDVPKLVVLDEAIELAKKFGSEQSSRFVNGLLDGLLKQHTFPGSLT